MVSKNSTTKDTKSTKVFLVSFVPFVVKQKWSHQ
jgi:hypothetical protein